MSRIIIRKNKTRKLRRPLGTGVANKYLLHVRHHLNLSQPIVGHLEEFLRVEVVVEYIHLKNKKRED